MNLYKEILCNLLAKEDVTVSFPNLTLSATDIVEMTCYQAFKKLKLSSKTPLWKIACAL